MKVSVRLPAEDVQFLLDEYPRRHESPRSAAVHEVIRTLRDGTPPDAYAQARSEWDADGEPERWE